MLINWSITDAWPAAAAALAVFGCGETGRGAVPESARAPRVGFVPESARVARAIGWASRLSRSPVACGGNVSGVSGRIGLAMTRVKRGRSTYDASSGRHRCSGGLWLHHFGHLGDVRRGRLGRWRLWDTEGIHEALLHCGPCVENKPTM